MDRQANKQAAASTWGDKRGKERKRKRERREREREGKSGKERERDAMTQSCSQNIYIVI